MRILSVRVLEGPNLYSYRPVLRVKVDAGEYEERSSATIAGFCERLRGQFPRPTQPSASTIFLKTSGGARN